MIRMVLVTSLLFASYTLADEKSEGLTYINKLRINSGLVPFVANSMLDTAAEAHSSYLYLNNTSGHYENPSLAGFYAATPNERVEKAGYNGYSVSENVSVGNANIDDSIDNLMSAIYHRFGFLNFGLNEIGMGISYANTTPERGYFTYDMGVDSSNKYTQNLSANSQIVTFPYANQDDFYPAFYEESPDPIPDCAVTGDPISVQFNPDKVSTISLNSFKLFDASNNEITNTRLLTNITDPNNEFSNNEFALYPMERLEWGKSYRANFSYYDGTSDKNFDINFQVRKPSFPLYEVTTSGKSFNVKSGTTYAMYLKPDNCNDTAQSFGYAYSSNEPEIAFIDFNTYAVKVTGNIGDQVRVTPSNGKEFTLVVATSDSADYFEESSSTNSTYADFNSDSKSDILWRNNNTRQNIVWLMNGTTKSSYTFLPNVGAQWDMRGSGDFNSDGKSDILWRNNTTGQNVVWFMNGTTKSSYAFLPNVNTQWDMRGSGDFNGDGKSDILWRNNTTGQNIVWLMDGTTKSSYTFLPNVGVQWDIKGSGDFNKDGKSDILWRNLSTGQSVVWIMNGTTKASHTFLPNVGAQWDIKGSGDFNSDGHSDILWRNSTTGQNIVWLMNGTTKASYTFLPNVGAPWDMKN